MNLLLFRLPILFSVIFLNLTPTNAANKTSQNQITYILSLNLPEKIKNAPTINASYKGYRLAFENKLCYITEAKQSNNFVLVITPEVEPKIEGKSVKYLERSKDKPCRLFYISNFNFNDLGNLDWTVEEEKPENLPIKLPEDAIIILMNPNYIEKIQPINSTNKNNNLKHLAEIIIKKDVSQDELDHESIYSALASMSPNAFCTLQTKQSKEKECIFISKSNSPNI